MATTQDDVKIGIGIQVDSPGVAKALQELATVRKGIDSLGGEFAAGTKGADAYTKELAKLEAQARKLDTALTSVGENRRINAAGGLTDPSYVPPIMAEPPSAGAGLRRFGRELRMLPSVQIPGAGIGTDAVANVIRLGGAFTDLTAKTKIAAVAANVLTPALGAEAAASYAAYAPIALLAAGIVAIGVAISALVSSTSQNVDRINTWAENQRDLNKRIADGLTSDQAQAELDNLTAAQERNRQTLATLQGAYDASQNQLGVLSVVSRVFSGDEQALADQIEQTNKTINEQQGDIDALRLAMEDGSLAANTAAEAEDALAKARTSSLLTEAQQAGELAQLRDRVSTMTADQIATEMESVERRRLGVEAELAVLQASGDTSEEVAKKIAQLTGQLGFLGDQANVLKNATPKADTKEAEKAAKEAEKAMQDAARAQQSYSDKVRNAGTRYRDALADIKTTQRDKIADNQRKYWDDILSGSIDFNADMLQSQRDYERDLASIRRDAARDELDATRSRDFAALRDAREQASAAIRDRSQEQADNNADELTKYRLHLDELARDRENANRDAGIDAQRAARDAKTDRLRANRDARQDLNDYHRDRAAQEQNFMRSSLNSWQSYFNQIGRMQSQMTGTSGGSGGSSGGGTMPSFDQFQYAFGGGQ